MFGRFSREGVSSTRPRWQSVPARRRRLQPASPRGPPRLTPVKPGRERSASAPPAPPGGGTCQAPAPHLGLRSLLLVDPGSAPGRARLPRVRSVRESRRPRVTTAEPRARSAGSWSGAPSAPRAPTLPAAYPPPPPPAAGVQGRAQAGARDPGTLRARPGAWGRRRRGAAALGEEGGGQEEGLPARGRGGASGRAAEPSELAPEPAPPPARTSGARRPRRRRPRGDVGCWWTPGSSGGGGGCSTSPAGGSLSSGR